MSTFFVSPYTICSLFLLLGTVVGVVIYFISYLFVSKSSNNEKVSVYECGFDPFTDSAETFDVRYYLVAILFIIFDLELTFLFPWSLVFKQLGFYGFVSVFSFLSVLTLGFVYEWLHGALDWS